jgi:hypothetical protein
MRTKKPQTVSRASKQKSHRVSVQVKKKNFFSFHTAHSSLVFQINFVIINRKSLTILTRAPIMLQASTARRAARQSRETEQRPSLVQGHVPSSFSKIICLSTLICFLKIRPITKTTEA